jgi:prepilin-type N-terminal cleavage/methylation domain-containing protein
MISIKKGFTLIELLVVISIIALLSSIVLAALQEARAKARDAVRKNDLRQIANALELYRSDHGNYLVKNSSNLGCGSSGLGIGWFNYTYASYGGSVAQCLFNGKYIAGLIIDPSKNTASYNNIGSPYMIYVDGSGYTVWASLEKPSAADLATQNRCLLSGYDGYPAAWPAERRMNYCISN